MEIRVDNCAVKHRFVPYLDDKRCYPYRTHTERSLFPIFANDVITKDIALRDRDRLNDQ